MAESKLRSISDIVHGFIELPQVISLIVDTEEFQRLREITQVGILNRVFPSTIHDRFTHSLGTYWLARKYIERLRISELNESERDEEDKRKRRKREIDERDELCVCIAALIHDLGHGPFSHTYEGFLEHVKTTGFRHERMSIRIFRHMRDADKELDEGLHCYLEDIDFVFIEELIDPPYPFVNSHGEWVPKGRPREKAFLYDIVSNKRHGLDVDKMDYFLRDSTHANVGIVFNNVTVERIMQGTRILDDDSLGYPVLAFDEKNSDELREAFMCRASLHKKLYRHKTCVALEHVLFQVLADADPYLLFEGDDGKQYTLSSAWKNVAAFLQVDNRVLYLGNLFKISNSVEEKLKPIKEQLSDFKRRRNLPKFIGEVILDPKDYASMSDENGELDTNRIRIGIENRLERFAHQLRPTNFLVVVLGLHQGLGVEENPMKRVLVHSKGDKRTRKVDKSWLDANCPPNSGLLTAFIYQTAEADEEQSICLQSAYEQLKKELTEGIGDHNLSL